MNYYLQCSRHIGKTIVQKQVKNDLLLAMDKQRVVFLVLLDMSAAFDLIKHVILVDTLQTHFGITDFGITGIVMGKVIFGWYRRQRVEVDGILSREFDVLCTLNYKDLKLNLLD